MKLYCIDCERYLKPIENLEVERFGYHLLPIFGEDWKSCYGFFTSCPPPEIEDGWYGLGWQDNLTEPSEDELAMMDLNAKELLLELA